MSNEIPSRNDWFIGCKGKSIFDDKEKLIADYMCLFFTRTNVMFEYEGLPETIPKEDYTLIKQTYGSVTIAKASDEKIYALYGGLGGVLNEYYHPTISVVANPYLNLTKTFEIGKDCIVIKNDLFYRGIFNINRKYAELLTECDISIRKCLLNIRVDNILTSSSDVDDASINAFFDAVKRGDFAYIQTKRFMDDVLLQIHDVASKTSNPLKDLIEIRNYIESCWWMEFGLNANANMKRESINDAEINADDKTMIPLIKQFYDCEIKGWDEVNKMFNLNVKVRLSEVWQKMYDEVVEEPKEPSNEVVEEVNTTNNVEEGEPDDKN